jgi:hypothetical protein
MTMGEDLPVMADGLDALGKAAVIAAQPGFTLLTLYDDGSIERMPIIGWRIAEGDRMPSPITLPNEVVNEECFVAEGVLMPDGRVRDLSRGKQPFASEAEWVATLIEAPREAGF